MIPTSTALSQTPSSPAPLPGAPVLEVEDLSVEFRTPKGVVRAVNGISYEVNPGETVAILGESGSGKSVSVQAVMGILDSPPGFVTGGRVLFEGRDLLGASAEEQRAVRGPGISMIFQDALSSLNPVFTVGHQIAEMFRAHQGTSRKEAKEAAIELLDRVRIPAARERVNAYPHQFSGGMRQRVMIAMALALNPKVLIADEPTTALDVTVQAQIMELLKDLQRDTGMGLLLITHDLGVVNEVADRVLVMYAGNVVETGTVDEVFSDPSHPYTEGLMASVPAVEDKGKRLQPIVGTPPDLSRIPPGCSFHPRCPRRVLEGAPPGKNCQDDIPLLLPVGTAGRASACHYRKEVLRARSAGTPA